MRRAIGAGVILMILGCAAVGFPLAGIQQPHGAPTEDWRQASHLTAPALVPPSQEAGYPCPPVGTEGPPARDLPESRMSARPAVGAAVYFS
jgi:hypothetical protein